MAYHYTRKITVSDARESLPDGMRWVKGRPQYQVRSDGGGLSTKFDDCETLTAARKLARQHAKRCGWAEIFRWCENAQSLRKRAVAVYERELQA
jgi:hypothetical protein